MANDPPKTPSKLKRLILMLLLSGLLAFLIWFYFISDFSNRKDVHLINTVQNGQYTIYCQPEKFTFIIFPKDEYVETYLILDKKQWNIEKLSDHNVLGSILPFASWNTSSIEILPKESSGFARFMIKTNKNTYYIKCIIDASRYKRKVIFKNESGSLKP